LNAQASFKLRPAISVLLEFPEVVTGMAGIPLPVPIAGRSRRVVSERLSKVSIRVHDEIAAAIAVRPLGASTVDDLLAVDL
jgi:hypothetical protein